MATQATTVAYLAEQTAAAGAVTTRAMFGEFAIFCDGRMVALVCDDQLFVKPTAAGRAYLGAGTEGAVPAGAPTESGVTEAPPYTGAKTYFRIDEVRWDDREWLTTLVRVSAAELPLPATSRRTRRAQPGGSG